MNSGLKLSPLRGLGEPVDHSALIVIDSREQEPFSFSRRLLVSATWNEPGGIPLVLETPAPNYRPFENAIKSILSGLPLGLALRDFSRKYASLSTSLADMLAEIRGGAHFPDSKLTSEWIERNDAGGYLIFGDPAVRLRVTSESRCHH